MEKDLYKILEVERNVSQEDIKKSYRRLSKKYHPDHNPDNKEAESRFKEISAAYAVLSNPDRRRDYDNPASNFNLNEFFNGFGFGGSIFSRVRRQRPKPDPNRPLKGLTINMEIGVLFTKFILNGQIDLKFDFMDICLDCKGTGAKESKICGRCNGSGQVIEVKSGQGVYMQTASTCPECKGRGGVVIENCDICSGSGKIEVKNKKVRFDVLKGMRDGSTIRLEAAGGKGVNGGVDGDLIIKLNMILPTKDDLTEEQLKILEEIDNAQGGNN